MLGITANVDPTKLRPLFDNILVQPLEDEKETESGIIIPDTAEKLNLRLGKVMKVGFGKVSMLEGVLTPMHVEVGETVLFQNFKQEPLPNGWLLIRETDIVLAVEEGGIIQEEK